MAQPTTRRRDRAGTELDLKHEQETGNCCVAAQHGDQQALERAMALNDRLVWSIARRLQYSYGLRHMLLEDVVQYGRIGLADAVRRFDPKRGVRFSGYATWAIRQSIVRAIDRDERMIRLPAYAAAECNLLRRKQARLNNLHGREPTIDELGAALGWPSSKVADRLKDMDAPLQLDWLLGDDTSTRLIDLLEGDQPSPEEESIASQTAIEMQALLSCLRPRAALIITLRFGLDGKGRRTLQEVGELLGGVSREGIRQSEARSLNQLRRTLNGAGN